MTVNSRGVEVHSVVGIAGGGKTTYAMGLIEQHIKEGGKVSEIAFCSFSKAASIEAAERAAKLTGQTVEALTTGGWFRTLHSAALKCLGLGKDVVLGDRDSKRSKEFFKDVFGYQPRENREEFDDGHELHLALTDWDFERAQLNEFVGVFTPEAFTVQYSKVDLGTVLGKPSGYTGSQTENSSKNDTKVDPLPESLLSSGGCNAPTKGDLYINGSVDMRDQVAVPCVDQDVSHRSGLHPPEDTVGRVVSHPTVPTSVNAGIGESVRDPLYPLHSTFSKKIPAYMSHARSLILKYEHAKRLLGLIDFTDMLMKFAGVQVDDELKFRQAHAEGSDPDGITLLIIDEAQDCSRLLWHVAQRLSEVAGKVIYIGDERQAVYGFQGSEGPLLGLQQREAKKAGNHTVLNQSYRNPMSVIHWGEDILEQDDEYESRHPFSEGIDGTVGAMRESELLMRLDEFANSDVMIIGRANWVLSGVTAKLNRLAIPWRSTQKQNRSRWDCPVKIALTLVMRELQDGKMISEQDWRRVTEEYNQKIDGIEMFDRGTKAKWKKIECSQEQERTVNELESWGATQAFVDFVKNGMWKIDMPMLIDRAIDKFGLPCVRNPRIRVGTVHSVKGMEAVNVFCLAESSKRCEDETGTDETRCLKYVAITRAKRNYRLVIPTKTDAVWFRAAGKSGFHVQTELLDVGVVEDVVQSEADDEWVPKEHRPAAGPVETYSDDYEWFDL